MEIKAALELCSELKSLIGDSPGPNTMAEIRIKTICSSLEASFPLSGFVPQIHEIIYHSGVWFSPRKWQQLPHGAESAKSNLLHAIGSLHRNMNHSFQSH